MRYLKPYDASNPDAPYVDGNPGAGIQGSIVPAGALEYPQRELDNLIDAAGITPSNSDLTQVEQAVRQIASDAAPATGLWYIGDDVGPTAAQIVADVSPAITAYGRFNYRIKASRNCTGPTTANFNGLGSRPIVRADGTPLGEGDFTQGQQIDLSDDGTKLQLVGVLTSQLPVSGILIFTSTTTYTIPAGVTKIKRARVWGGGGGGGGSTGANGSGSGGGGAGYHEAAALSVAPGNIIAITVGAGGAGGAGGASGNGGNGGTTSVGIQGQAAFLTSTGGGSGFWGNLGPQTTSAGFGGAGVGPGLSGTGGGGSLAYAIAGVPAAGAGGAGAFGGGSPTLNVGTGSNNGNFPGGGANGGVGGSNGGTGGGGLVILEI